jgi:hypothetical protein
MRKDAEPAASLLPSPNTRLFRLTAALAVGGLLLGPVAAPLALAQGAPAPAPAGGDPPARVGRLARIVGTVSFHTADQAEWEPATLNYPITSGNSLWTQPAAASEIQVGPSSMNLDQSTELDVTTLDDHTLSTTIPQGAVFLNVRAVQTGDVYQIVTPRGIVTIGQPGRYEVVAGDVAHPTMVTVVDGAAQITGANMSVTVNPRQTAQLTGTDGFQATVGAEVEDAFLARFLAPPPVAVNSSYTPPPVVLDMTGGDVVEQTGSWAATPDYGEVWYPPVQAGWVPYREGHWAYVAPWGWTWVDNASWGFAPFHYGRWVQVGPRWGWVPVDREVLDQPGYGRPGYGGPGYGGPVYSPALVAFVGLGAGVAVGAAIGASVGWIPLGPREVYRPPYRVSENYLRQLNVTNVRNVTNITNVTNNNVTINNFANRGGATVVPAAAMTSSQPIAQRVQRVTPQMLAAARPVATVPVRPTVATAGITPAVARQLNIAPAGRPLPQRPAAPGPALTARPVAGAPGRPLGLRPSGGAPVPAAAPAPAVNGVRPGAPAVPGAAPAGRPGAPATPSLVRPGVAGAPVRGGAPGPAINGVRPGVPAVPGAVPAGRPGAPATPPLVRPGAPGAPAKGGAPGPAIRPTGPAVNGVRPPVPGAPAVRPGAPAIVTPGNVPRPGEPAATPQVQRPGVPVPAARPVPHPAPVAPRPAAIAPHPVPQAVARPAPVVRAAPAHPAPVVRAAPARPAPVVRAAPPRPAPVVRAAPPRPAPVVRAAPPRPAPVAHAAPPPRPAPHPAPAPAPAKKPEHP